MLFEDYNSLIYYSYLGWSKAYFFWKVLSNWELTILFRPNTLWTKTTSLLKMKATFGASSVGHQEDAAFGGIKINSLFLAPLAT